VTQTTGPAWDWVDSGEVRGAWGGQCRGCGGIGLGWIGSGARRLPDDAGEHDAFTAALVEEVEASRELWAAGERPQIRARLLGRLRDAAEAVRAGGLDPGALTLDELDSIDSGSGVCDGSELSPGVYLDAWGSDAGQLVAWAADPVLVGECIVVAVSDLEAVGAGR
jgi:hypothetical protein